MNETSGVIVAGGRSIRMGGMEKTVVDVAGTPLIRRVADRLLAATDDLIVNCRADQRAAIEDALDGLAPTFAIEDPPDGGPVAGIKTGLEATETEHAAVVASDMPFLEPGLIAHLLDRVEGHDAAVPRPGEWFEPLHAAYRSDRLITACERALEAENPKILEPLSRIDRVIVGRAELLEHGSLDSFESVDTPDDVEWASERLSSD
jgi:molybdopterin-guanine dinucleotide biosynthesis protein A